MAIPHSVQDILNAIFSAGASSGLNLTPIPSSQDFLNAVLNSAEDALTVKLENFPVETSAAISGDTLTTLETIATTSDSVTTLTVDLIGVSSDGLYTVHVQRIATYKNDGGTLTERGSATNLHSEKPSGYGGLSMAISGTDILIQVAGKTGVTTKWQVQTMINQLEY